MSAQKRVKKPALKAAFNKQAMPRFCLKKTVADMYAMFPEFSDTVFVIDLEHNKIIHPDKKTREAMTVALGRNKALMKELQKDTARAASDKSSFCKEVTIDGKSIRFLALYLGRDMADLLDKNIRTLSMSRFSIFDHELAHAIVEGAQGHDILSESVADAFMVIRHIQRFGLESPLPDIYFRRRAAYAFLNQDVGHFTSPALENVIAIKDKIDYKTLSPTETMRLAEVIGVLSTPSKREMGVLKKHFNKQRDRLKRLTSDKSFSAFTEAVFTSKSPLVQKWGSVALFGFFDILARKAGGKASKARFLPDTSGVGPLLEKKPDQRRKRI